jgi:hypothetical protein
VYERSASEKQNQGHDDEVYQAEELKVIGARGALTVRDILRGDDPLDWDGWQDEGAVAVGLVWAGVHTEVQPGVTSEHPVSSPASGGGTLE